MSEDKKDHKFKMMRQFAVFQWEYLNLKVKNLKSEIFQLEKRKRMLWDFIGELDEMNKRAGYE